MTLQYPRLAETLPTVEELTFSSGGARLSGRLYRPGYPAKAAIVLHSATGVPQGYYRAFAQWLSENGYACLTYDYRDLGQSQQKAARDSKTTMAQWGQFDQAAAQAALEARVPATPVWAIGHSLGGLMIPFQPAAARRLTRIITVASGPVHFSDHPRGALPKVGMFWYGLGPLLTKIMGYLPGRLLGLGPDIPASVYWQWRRWCTKKGFYMNDVGGDLPYPDFAAFRGRLKAVAVSDDFMVPPVAVWRLMQLYPEAYKSQLTLRPQDYGLKSIGHIGMFRKENAALWPAILAEA